VRIPRRTTAVLGIAILLLCLVAGGIWRTERALREAGRKVAHGRDIAVTIRAFVSDPNPGFETISTPASFRSAAAFNGRFYLAGPGGLFVYSNDGSLLHVFHPGADLPAAPLGQLATATLADSNGPELLVATSGDPGPTDGQSPAFFSGNIASLSRMFATVDRETVSERDEGAQVTQTVLYYWRRP
jgi:hypothetical protein